MTYLWNEKSSTGYDVDKYDYQQQMETTIHKFNVHDEIKNKTQLQYQRLIIWEKNIVKIVLADVNKGTDFKLDEYHKVLVYNENKKQMLNQSLTFQAKCLLD